MKNIAILSSGFLIFLLILFLPLNLPFIQKVTLGTALLMATYWATEAIPIPVTSLLPLILFPLFSVESSEKVAKAYIDPVIFLFLGGFILATAVEKWNLHLRIALKILLFFKGSLALTLLGFMVSSSFLSMWISNTATTMMMLPITLSLIKLLKEKSNLSLEKYFRALLLSIAYSSSIGGVGTLIGSPPNLLLASFYSRQFQENPMTFLKWFLFGFPFVLILLPLAWLLLIFYSGGFSKLKGNFEELKIYLIQEKKKLGKISKEEKFVLLIFFFTCLLWITRAPISFGSFKIPGWSEIFSYSSFFHDSFVAILFSTSLFFIRINKRPLLEWNEVEKRVPWGILLLFGGGLSLADTFIKSGLSKSFGALIGHFQFLNFPLFLFFICGMISALTELTSNTAITATMLPILFSIVPKNINPIILLLPATIASSFAFMFPVATPPNAIIFSSGHLNIKTMIKIGIFMNLISIIILTVLSITILDRIF